MPEPTSILYVRPGWGGVRIYSDLMLRTLSQASGLRVDSVVVQENRPLGVVRGLLLGLRLASSRHDALYIELGAHGTSTAWATLVAGMLRRKTFLTVHDGAIVVETLFPFTVMRRLPKPICSVGNRLSRLADALFKRRLLNFMVARATAVFSLAPDEVVCGRRTRHVPPPSYVSQPPSYIAPAAPVIGFVGYWGGAKGIETLIRALAALRHEGLTVRAVVAGSTGDPEDFYSRSVRGLAAELSLDVQFPGFVPDDEMESVLGGLTAVVIPYLRDHPASSSGVAVWGLSLGVPVVASDIPALRRQLGDAATYFEPGSAEALAAALRTVMNDQAVAVSRAHEAQTRFFSEHGDEAISRLVAHYITESV